MNPDPMVGPWACQSQQRSGQNSNQYQLNFITRCAEGGFYSGSTTPNFREAQAEGRGRIRQSYSGFEGQWERLRGKKKNRQIKKFKKQWKKLTKKKWKPERGKDLYVYSIDVVYLVNQRDDSKNDTLLLSVGLSTVMRQGEKITGVAREKRYKLNKDGAPMKKHFSKEGVTFLGFRPPPPNPA